MRSNHPPPPLDVHPFHGRYVRTASRIKRLLYRIVPRHTLFPFWKELQIAWVRRRAASEERRYHNARDLLVNLGAGDTGRPGWVNVDTMRLQGITCQYDCRQRLPFATASVRGIFCEHFFEHIDYTEEVPFFLSECYRVLQPGGVVRIIVPDAGRYLHAYTEPGWQTIGALRSLHPDQTDPLLRTVYHTKMELINAVFRQGHEHKFAYDYETLAFVLQRYGFAHIEQQSFGVSRLPELCIDQPQRAAESLYVEAVRPAN